MGDENHSVRYTEICLHSFSVNWHFLSLSRVSDKGELVVLEGEKDVRGRKGEACTFNGE